MSQKLIDDANLGTNLRRLRLAHGYTQKKLCQKLKNMHYGIGLTTYGKSERGQVAIRAELIVFLRKLYKCRYEDFFDGTMYAGRSPSEI